MTAVFQGIIILSVLTFVGCGTDTGKPNTPIPLKTQTVPLVKVEGSEFQLDNGENFEASMCINGVSFIETDELKTDRFLKSNVFTVFNTMGKTQILSIEPPPEGKKYFQINLNMAFGCQSGSPFAFKFGSKNFSATESFNLRFLGKYESNGQKALITLNFEQLVHHMIMYSEKQKITFNQHMAKFLGEFKAGVISKSGVTGDE